MLRVGAPEGAEQGQINAAHVKLAPSWLPINPTSSSAKGGWGGGVYHPIFLHLILFLFQSLGKQRPCTPSAAKKVAGWEFEHCCNLQAEPSDGAKSHFRHKENEGKESHRAHVGTGIAFPPGAGGVQTSRTATDTHWEKCGGWRRQLQAVGPGTLKPEQDEDENDTEAGFVAPFLSFCSRLKDGGGREEGLACDLRGQLCSALFLVVVVVIYLFT